MRRVGLYARTSTCDQHPEAQLDPLRRYAEHCGLEVVGVYVDAGQSGAKASRPALDEVLAAARRPTERPAPRPASSPRRQGRGPGAPPAQLRQVDPPDRQVARR